MASFAEAEYLRGLVDMGSNGIRFSISDVSPTTARVVPTVYQDRVAISLYDAQHDEHMNRIDIPQHIINDLISAFKTFQQTCDDFGVRSENVQVIATEATRTASNSMELRHRIKDEIGWEVTMLPKEKEGEIGAYGIASSFQHIEGLVMDLGGGSTQLSWLEVVDGKLKFNKGGSVSLPYGAAALTNGLAKAKNEGKDALKKYKGSVKDDLKEAYHQIMSNVRKTDREQGHISLFLSGGGFRGWGYILMEQHRIRPYPIPIINGFRATPEEFTDVSAVQANAKKHEIFRVSERRAEQVPAVGFLVSTLCETIPEIKDVRFAQGGVREGWLFSKMDNSIRATPPLSAATAAFAPPSSGQIEDLIRGALPGNQPSEIDDILTGFTNLLYAQVSLPKESRPAAALRATTSGILAGVHGLVHEQRAALALALCERWGAEVSPTDTDFLERLRELAGPQIVWWSQYLGRVGHLVGSIYPAGMIKDSRLSFTSSKPQRSQDMELVIDFKGEQEASTSYGKGIKDIAKMGKKKHWVGGKEGWGIKLNIIVKENGIEAVT